jgi:hypothetical protein
MEVLKNAYELKINSILGIFLSINSNKSRTFVTDLETKVFNNLKTNSVMYYINEEMKNKVEGKEVSFTYNGKTYVRKVHELLDVIFGTWVGDLGYEDENDTHSDSFIIHGNTDDNNLPIMEGLVIQYDSADGKRHGYVREVNVIQ